MLQPHEGPSETTRVRHSERGPRRLQPHEGPSETHNDHATTCRRPRLQPHEGPSETTTGSWDNEITHQLQPHEGPSETRHRRHGNRRETPSFNPTRVHLKQRSLNQGAVGVRFNPTRVHLKPVDIHHMTLVCRELQPHEGPSETR